MKTENSTPYLEVTKLLYLAFDHFNKVLCKGELKTPIIYVGSRGRKAAYGWLSPSRWENKDKDSMNEINICAETLNRGFAEIMETLVHELTHHFNDLHKIKDVGGNQWHNAKFKKQAEEFGLIVTKMKGHGWAQTTLGPKAKELIKSLPFTEKQWPQIKRLERRSGGLLGSNNTFVICTKSDKQLFQELTAGMKQTEAFAELLRVYEEHADVSERKNHVQTA